MLKNSFARTPLKELKRLKDPEPPSWTKKKGRWREKDGMGRGNGKRGVGRDIEGEEL